MGAALVLAWAGHAPAAGLVTNGGFETETLDGDSNPILPPPGWTVTGDGVGVDTSFPNSGTYDAIFTYFPGVGTQGVLSQAIATTPGKGYHLSFAVMDESAQYSDTFTVTFGGFSTTIDGDPPSYSRESFFVPGADITGSSTTLSFSGANNYSAWNLDDVSVGVPEPATWGLMLVGFGITGFALRRRCTRKRRAMS